MSTITANREYTPEDLLALPENGKSFELVDGRLVERNMGWKESWVGGRLHFFLSAFCETNSSGWVLPADASYQCYRDAPSKVRKPDVSFIRLERLPPARISEGHCPIAPDLAVEVISPNDLYYEVDAKVDEYQRAGVELVWVINPELRTVRVHRADGSVSTLNDKDTLNGEDVIPGFRCNVADLFTFPASRADVQ